jgi:ribosomal protein L6P/L9E
VAIPAGVDVSIKADQINVKGTGGTLSLTSTWEKKQHWACRAPLRS